ncbi:MAG: hypothetical protein WC749_02870 [Dehalococcoidia bacterium]
MKKLLVCGKGGTGKSVIVTLLTNVLSEDGYTVLAIDSDESNPGLYRALGFETAPSPIVNLFGGKRQVEEIVDRVSRSGGTEEMASEELAKTFAREKISLADIPSKYILQRDNIKLMTVGKIAAAYEGCACPMGVAIKAFLKKVVLKDNELVIVDTEAGIEHFGRGVHAGIDTVLIVAESSFESIALAAKINFMAKKSQIDHIYAVLNKAPTPEIEAKAQAELLKRGIKMIGTIPYDPQVAEACLEGRPLPESKAREAVRKIVDELMRP